MIKKLGDIYTKIRKYLSTKKKHPNMNFTDKDCEIQRNVGGGYGIVVDILGEKEEKIHKILEI